MSEDNEKEVAKMYPFTQTQLGIYMECIKQTGEAVYNNPRLFKIDPAICMENLAKALEEVIKAHEYIKAQILIDEDGNPRQHRVNVPYRQVIETMSDQEFEMLRERLVYPFDLTKPSPLFRFRLIQTDSAKYFFFDFHHMIFDGMSYPILMEDLNKAYHGEPVTAETWSGFEIAQEEEELRKTVAYEKARAWNLNQFQSLSVETLPLSDKKATQRLIGSLRHELVNVDPRKINEFCQANAIKKSTFFSGVYGILLASYTNSQEALFTTIFHGRTDKRVHKSICMMVKTHPVYARIDQHEDLGTYFVKLEEQIESSRKNTLYSFAEISAECQIKNPSLFVYQGAIDFSGNNLCGFNSKFEDLPFEATGEVLNVEVYKQDKYCVHIEWQENVYSREFIEQFAANYENILNQLINLADHDKNKSIFAQVDLVSKQEKEQLIQLAYGGKLAYDKTETFIDSFQRNVRNTPTKLAVVAENGSFTYQELVSVSDALAQELIKLGVKQNDFVCIMLPRIKEYMASTLAVFKAGGAYVPLDSEYPNERLLYMLEDSKAKVLITTREFFAQKQQEGNFTANQIIFIDEFDFAQNSQSVNHAQIDSLAYMIYTSGSTGKPKGVMVQHKALYAYLSAWQGEAFGILPSDHISCYPSFSFDASVDDLYGALFNGATLYIIPADLRQDMLGLVKYLEENKITGGTFSTQLGMELLNQFKVGLRYVRLGGEKLKPVEKTKTIIVNGYGPTEFTVCSSTHTVNQAVDIENIPIGRPLKNTWSYIVNENMQLVPQGVPGELCLAGRQIAKGYWNRPDLTAEKFIDNPYSTDDDNEKMYRSGDLVRWNESGELEYIGRIDNQVKLRGFRIELGEIESKIAGFRQVTGSVVEVKEVSGVQHLCAYFTAKEEINIEQLRDYLFQSLTDYMVPTVYMQLEKMPLTPNGKVNRKALPMPDIKIALDEIVAPENEKEAKIFAIVSELLQTEEFGVTNNLFSLGMTSMLAIKLSILIQKQLKIKIATKDILSSPTIRQMARLSGSEIKTVKAYEKREWYPLTENQKGLYIEWESHRESLQYNVPTCLKFRGIDAEKLKQAAVKFIEAHPYLKTKIAISPEGEIGQLRLDDLETAMSHTKLTTEPDQEFFAKRVRPFDLMNGNLYRIEIYETKQATYLFIDIHHIIYDGGSLNILFEELSKAYQGESLEKEIFTAFDRALEEAELLESKQYQEAESYFDQLLAQTESTNFSPITEPTGKGQVKILKLTIEGKRISEYCKANAVTENIFFLTSFMNALARLTGEGMIQITTVSNGRASVYLEKVMGMFVKTIPVVYEVSEKTAVQEMQTLQEQLFATISRDFYPFTTLVERNGVRPLVNYVYEGGIAESLAIGEIKGEVIPVELDTSKFPISLIVGANGGEYELGLEYDNSIYSEKDMQLLIQVIDILMKEIVSNSNAVMNKLSMIDKTEEEKLLKLAYGGDHWYNPEETFVDVFNKQVKASPIKPAVVAENGSFTYQELASASDGLAQELIKLDVKQDDFVCIMLPRIKEYMVSTLAVFKAGGAYVPLDSEYPNERLLYMLEDSKAKVLITTREFFARKQQEGNFTAKQIIFIDEFDFVPNSQSVNHAQIDSLAYMIYTSGSTGKPKGVMVQHKALYTYLSAWQGEAFGILPSDHISCYPSFSFDASVDDLYGALFNGATLYIIPADLRQDMLGFAKYLEENKITGVTFSTQLGMELMNQFKVGLRYIRLGGEKLKPVERTKTIIVNGYGPTEFTVCSSTHTVNQAVDIENIPIGRPLKNTWSYVLDKNMQLVPQGVAGELCLAGRQIAKGYWNRPELTEKVFVDNPYATCEENKKMYRTGDLVQWNENGELEYLGRIDNQVKLRGFRIELGEIESKIAAFRQVTGSVVEVKEVGGTQHLCAYFTSKETVNIEALRSYLAQSLTDYMVPNVYMQLEKLPLTPNGKVNRKALPMPKIERTTEYIAPTNEVETQICEVFKELLHTDEVGILDDFFLIGGTSMLAIKAIIKLNNLRYSIQYGDLFKWKTPETIAKHLMGKIEEHEAQAECFNMADYDYTAINQVLKTNAKGMEEKVEIEPLGNVVITGATGYLGAHILNELIEKGTNKIYCLLRPSKKLSIEERLKMMLMYYFDNPFEELIGKRIIPIQGDITEKESLEKIKAYDIQTIINCAAMVKHYEAGTQMEKVNYQGVVNLIELCKEKKLKLVQVSTYSTAGMLGEDGKITADKFDESRLYIGQTTDNKYIWTKFEAERAILEAVSQGLKAKIMRVGNLMARAEDGEFQINSGNNAFITRLKSYKILGAFPLKQSTIPIELSQIDKVAEAILLLATTPEQMVVFHPYNNFEINLGMLINGMKKCGYQIESVAEQEFGKRFDEMMHNERKSQYLSGMLHYGKMAGRPIEVTNEFTTIMLYQLGFMWPLPEKNYIEGFIKKLDGLGFFDE